MGKVISADMNTSETAHGDGHGGGSARSKVKAGQPHPYHLVRPSPWPLVASLSAGAMAWGGAHMMHKEGGQFWLFVGIAGLLATFFGWWGNVIKESNEEKAHSPIVVIGLKYGMLLFIASEIMFFFAFFWAFFDASLFPKEAIGGIWPPEGIEAIHPFGLPFMMTLILLLSGATLTWSHSELLEGNEEQAEQGLALTVLLGAVFTGLQLYEYSHVTFKFTDGIFASTFFMATGFHGLHVLIGTIFLAVCWWQLVKGHHTKDNHFGFEAAAWYWHFVDVVWLFLFVAIYWLGG